MAPAKPLKKAFPGPPPTSSEVSQFCMAAKDGDIYELTELLEKFGSAIIDKPDSSGDNALTWAAWAGNTETVKLLLEQGAAIDFRGQHGKTALVWGALNGRKDVVALLLKKGADPDIADHYGETALKLAKRGRHGEVEALVQKSLDKKRGREELAKADQEGKSLAAERLEKLKIAARPPKLKPVPPKNS